MEIRAWFLVGIVLSNFWKLNHSFGVRHSGYLISRTGVRMEIFPDKAVKGRHDKASKFAALRLSNIIGENFDGKVVSILGVESRMYLCMTRKGKMYGNARFDKNCQFIVHELPYHFMTFYRKVGSNKFFVGLTKSGRPRSGGMKNKRCHFLWKRLRRTRAV